MKHIRHFAIIIFALFLFFITAPAWASIPLVRNFTRATYSAGAQNWAIAQDSLGRMYFGNQHGLLIYDSQRWTLERMPNYSCVRSVLIDDEEDRIWVGATEEFGYFQINPETGRRDYHSLVGTIQSANKQLTEVWNIHRYRGATWFQSDFKILCYDGKTTALVAFDDKITTSALIDGRLYVGFQHGGVKQLNNFKDEDVPGTESLRGKRIVAIVPEPEGNGILVVTAFDGLWVVHNGAISQADYGVDAFLRENQAFSATFNAVTGQLAFGTVNNGAVIVRPGSTDNPTYINVAAGMQNNTVLNLAFDRDANLWMGLDNGIDYAVTNSAINRMPFPSWHYGAGYASLLQDGNLYLGTNRGLFSVPYATLHRPAMASTVPPLLRGQVWSIDTIGADIMVSSDIGLFYGHGNSFRQVDGVGGTWSVSRLVGNPNKALASTYEGFALLERAPGGWQLSHIIKGNKDVGGKFVQDSAGVIWKAHWMRGIYRMTLSDDLSSFKSVDLLTSADGLPTDHNNNISVVEGRMVFSTEGGFFVYNDRNHRFEPSKEFNEMFKGRHTARLYESPSNDVWSVSATNVWRARRDPGGAVDLDTATYQPLGAMIIPGFDHLQFINSETAIMATEDGFQEVRTNYRNLSPSTPTLYVSSIYANQDSLIYTAGLAPSPEKLKVPYSLNSLRIDFVTPEYRAPRAISYSLYLEGYDSDWSSWSRTSSKEYTHLSEGNYVLHLRSLDAYTGEISETQFEFAVMPPWYRSTLAKIFYFLLVIAAAYGVYRFMQLKAHRAAEAVEVRKEKELEQLKHAADEEALRKDYEIAHLKSQQLEHDIRHKSEELSNLTMNVIRKNEILLDIAGKLTKLQTSLEGNDAAGKQLTKIQHLIKENISHDDDWKSFTQNFDVVYENYTKRLLAIHPELNTTDLRVCCYLKMGLSSKEIAPLFNISYRSVEMTRYRLRKKMGLPREVNLTDYLQKI